MNQRPTGVTILAVLAIISGVFGMLAGITIAGLGSLGFGLAGAADLGALAFVAGGAQLIIGALYIAFAIGAWTGRPWAWATGIVVALANILIPVIWLILGWGGFTSTVVSVAIAAIILYYLNQPNVKRFFGR